MSNPNVGMTGYTPQPEGKRLPSMSEVEREVPAQSAGMTPLDDMISDERIAVEGWSTYSKGGNGNRRVWVQWSERSGDELADD